MLHEPGQDAGAPRGQSQDREAAAPPVPAPFSPPTGQAGVPATTTPGMSPPITAPQPTSSEGGLLERGLRWLSDALVFALLRIALVGVSFKEVRDRQVPTGFHRGDPVPSRVHNTQAEFLYKIAREDSSATDEKVKQLLTLSSSLATLALVFGKGVEPRWLVVLFVAALVATVVLCLSVLEVRRGMSPTLEDANVDTSQTAWGNDLYRSYRATRLLHGFRTDRYKAALRYFRGALLLLLVLAITASHPPSPMPAIRGVMEWIRDLLPHGSSGPSAAPPIDSTPGAHPPTP
jgi:hypothetical protein